MVKMPIQPIEVDGTEQYRFVPNRIIQAIFKDSRFDCNLIEILFTTPEYQSELEQFYQLTGVSLDYFAENHFLSNETYEAALKLATGDESNPDRPVIHAPYSIRGEGSDCERNLSAVIDHGSGQYVNCPECLKRRSKEE
jgi:hypothetical protein